MNEPQFYLAPCPVCEQGLCRVRVCVTDDNQMFGCVVCDECEATWTDPSLKVRFPQTSCESPVCPHSGVPLWSDSCRWADAIELTLLGWNSRPMLDT